MCLFYLKIPIKFLISISEIAVCMLSFSLEGQKPFLFEVLITYAYNDKYPCSFLAMAKFIYPLFPSGISKSDFPDEKDGRG